MLYPRSASHENLEDLRFALNRIWDLLVSEYLFRQLVVAMDNSIYSADLFHFSLVPYPILNMGFVMYLIIIQDLSCICNNTGQVLYLK